MQATNERLKKLREDKNLKQQEVATYLGITPSALSQYENGKRTPKKDILVKLASYYNVTVDHLLCVDRPSVSVSNDASWPIASSSSNYRYNSHSGADKDGLSETKSRIMASINSLPKKKQLEALTIIEQIITAIEPKK